ncbi:MAG: hypothetical protein ACTTIV_03375 [Campylobacter sp.]
MADFLDSLKAIKKELDKKDAKKIAPKKKPKPNPNRDEFRDIFKDEDGKNLGDEAFSESGELSQNLAKKRALQDEFERYANLANIKKLH